MAFISTTAFAGPNCDWKPIKTDTTKSNGYSFQVVTLDCNIEYFKDDIDAGLKYFDDTE